MIDYCDRYIGIFLGLIAANVLAQPPSATVADSLYTLGNYAAAINSYASIGSPKAQLQIARAYNAMGDYEKAMVQYGSVIQKDSNNLLAQFELGKLLDKTKKYGQAEAVFQTLTKKSADNPEFYYYLGKVQRALLYPDEGNTALAKAVALDSTHLRSIFLLCKNYVATNQLARAHKLLDKGLQTVPDDVALLNLKALAYFQDQDYKKSIAYFERVVEMGEHKPFLYKKMGFANNYIWQFDKAAEAYHALAGFEGYQADGYQGLGEVFLRKKQLDSAEIYFKKAIEERRYTFEEEYASLGRIARLQNDNKKALAYYKKSWQEDRSNPYRYWQICIVADAYYKDPQPKLHHYQKLLTDFDDLMPFLRERAQKRVGELKEALHFKQE